MFIKIAMSRRSYCDLSISTALRDILPRAYGVLIGDCLLSHGASTVCTELSRRAHCTCTAFYVAYNACGLIRTPSDGVCFEHAQCAPLLGVLRDPTAITAAMPLRCRGVACDSAARRSAYLNFLERRGNAALS